MKDTDIKPSQLEIEKLKQQNVDMLETLYWIKANYATHSGVEVFYKCKEAIERVEG